MKKYLTLKNLGWVFTGLVVLMLGMSGISKLISTEEMVNNFKFMNLLPYLPFVGLAEVIGVSLLVFPRTSIYGAVLLGSIMSAAVALHLSMMGGQGVLVPVVLGLFAWTSHCLRQNCKKN